MFFFQDIDNRLPNGKGNLSIHGISICFSPDSISAKQFPHKNLSFEIIDLIYLPNNLSDGTISFVFEQKASTIP
ncbi:MAG: hypothetical protein A4E72_00175 [Syntrophus sp. PtaU1.Bin208]|nr:MAG: hypothetical protein A4E72_00175 [Syntrophus sp. PtaU1.Bin208]